MSTGAPRRRIVRAGLLRSALVLLVSLVAFLAPAAGSPAAVTPSVGATAGCAASEVHEELRPGRPERERAQPALPRGDRGPVGVRAREDAAVPHANSHFVRTQVEALPHPLERIPIRRN